VNLADANEYGLVVFTGSTGANTRANFRSVSGPAFGGSAGPQAPTGLAATAGNGQVSLDWNDNPEADIQGYNVFRDGTKVNAALVTQSQYVDTGLTNGTQYCYTVRAVNPGGESSDSAQSCATPTSGGGGPNFKRGDADASGTLDLTDAIFILGFLFQGGAEPPCLDAADADDSGALDLTDAIFVLGYLFQGGATPPAPGPKTCGPDTTPSAKITKACVYAPCQ
jgi:hypothetical protein